jgi:uncharacterized protein YkwD
MRVILLGLLIALAPGIAPGQPGAALKLSALEKEVLDLINAERKKEDLKPLKAQKILMKLARDHAANMARQNRMNHVLDDKNPKDRIDASGYKYRSFGENVAEGQRTAKAVVKEWMDSPIHKKNILNPRFTEIGIGMAKNRKGVPFHCQVFARPR